MNEGLTLNRTSSITTNPNVTSYKVKKYISERQSELEDLIIKHNRLLIEANPGLGKTRFVIDYIKKNYSPKKKIVYCSPLRLIVNQFKEDLKKYLPLNENKKIVIANTYYGFQKSKIDLTGKDIIFIDEAHDLFKYYNNDKKGKIDKDFYFKLFSLLYRTKAKVVFLTGTPREGLRTIFDVVTIRITKEIQSKTIIQLYENEYDVEETILSFVTRIKNENKKKLTHIIYLNDKKIIASLKAKIEELDKNLKVILLSSDKKGEKEFHLLDEEKKISDDVDIVLTTSVIASGVSILNENIGHVLMFNEYDPINIKQFSKRFRKINNLNVLIFNNPLYFQNDTLGVELINNYLGKELKSLKKIYKQIKKTKKFKLKIDLNFYNSNEGTKKGLLESVVNRMLIQEGYYYSLKLLRFSQILKLKDELQKYDDLEIPEAKKITSLPESSINFDELDVKVKKLIENYVNKIKEDKRGFISKLYSSRNCEFNHDFVLQNFFETFFEYQEINDLLNQEGSPCEDKFNVLIKDDIFKQYILNKIRIHYSTFRDLDLILDCITLFSEDEFNKYLYRIHFTNKLKNYFEVEKSKDDYKQLKISLNKTHNSNLFNKRESLENYLIEKTFNYLIERGYFYFKDYKTFIESEINDFIQKEKLEGSQSFPFDKIKIVDNRVDSIKKSFLMGLGYSIFYISRIGTRVKLCKNIIIYKVQSIDELKNILQKNSIHEEFQQKLNNKINNSELFEVNYKHAKQDSKKNIDAFLNDRDLIHLDVLLQKEEILKKLSKLKEKTNQA